MDSRSNRERLLESVADVLRSAQFTNALATVAIGFAFLATTMVKIMGWAGAIGPLVVMVVLALASVIVRRGELDRQGLLPISLLVFLGWMTLSLLWTDYRWSVLGGVAYFAMLTVLGVFIAATRDMIQIVRLFGDVLRLVLVVSLALEIFAGLLVDDPITFLGIQGNIAAGGPLQGLLGGRDQFGLVALLALITFAIELRTKSVTRAWGVGSLVIGLAAVLLARSPVVTGAAVLVLVATGVLYAIRRISPARRTSAQLITLGSAFVVGALIWVFRARVIDALSASSELKYRLDVWERVFGFISLSPVEGWGWTGAWRLELQPYLVFTTLSRTPRSALSAYVDVWFQLGFVGLAIFVGLVGLAFVRSWLLAGRRRSTVYAWPALMLVALLGISLFDSSLITAYGWLTFVVCCVRAAGELSWRTAFARQPRESLPHEPGTGG
jgi:O-antigen ligase